MSNKYPNWAQADEIIKMLVQKTFNIYIYKVKETNDIVISYLDRDAQRALIPASESETFNLWYNSWVNWLNDATGIPEQLTKYQVDVLGNISKVSKESRKDFMVNKYGKK